MPPKPAKKNRPRRTGREEPAEKNQPRRIGREESGRRIGREESAEKNRPISGLGSPGLIHVAICIPCVVIVGIGSFVHSWAEAVLPSHGRRGGVTSGRDGATLPRRRPTDHHRPPTMPPTVVAAQWLKRWLEGQRTHALTGERTACPGCGARWLTLDGLWLDEVYACELDEPGDPHASRQRAEPGATLARLLQGPPHTDAATTVDDDERGAWAAVRRVHLRLPFHLGRQSPVQHLVAPAEWRVLLTHAAPDGPLIEIEAGRGRPALTEHLADALRDLPDNTPLNPLSVGWGETPTPPPCHRGCS
jgi:hypothetical protein